eukprot:scaffold752_cov322-Pavlova_lutheri.AAC.54
MVASVNSNEVNPCPRPPPLSQSPVEIPPRVEIPTWYKDTRHPRVVCPTTRQIRRIALLAALQLGPYTAGGTMPHNTTHRGLSYVSVPTISRANGFIRGEK